MILGTQYPNMDVGIKVEELINNKPKRITTVNLPDANWNDRRKYVTLAILETISSRFVFTFTGTHVIAPKFIRLSVKPRLHNHEAKSGKVLRLLERDVVNNYAENTIVKSSKIDKITIENHLNNGMNGDLTKPGEPIGDGKLHGLLIDSWESHVPTCTINSEDMFTEFKTRRGCSIKRYLPATMGFLVDDVAITNNFLRDLLGKGKVCWGKTLDEVLKEEGVAKDVVVPELLEINWIHRETNDADIYFVASKDDAFVDFPLSFRITNLAPQIWGVLTGNQQKANVGKT